jgi:hypothetical protein
MSAILKCVKWNKKTGWVSLILLCFFELVTNFIIFRVEGFFLVLIGKVMQDPFYVRFIKDFLTIFNCEVRYYAIFGIVLI